MKFRAHETFYIRKGWLNKGLNAVHKNPEIFVKNSTEAMDELGIGSNMVKSLRYWLQCVGLTSEAKNHKQQQLTDLGKLVYGYDPYIEELGTICLLHHVLMCNEEMATTWYFFYNKFTLKEFDKDDFIHFLKKYISAKDASLEVALRSLEDDFNCLIGMYLGNKNSEAGIDPENNITSPFSDLKLVNIINKKNKVYVRNSIGANRLPPLIMLAIILKQAAGAKEIKISSILNDYDNIGKAFNLDIVSLTNILYTLELKGLVKIVRTAGLDVIQLTCDLDYSECIKLYYKNLEEKA